MTAPNTAALEKNGISMATPKLGFGCMRLPLTDPEDVTAIDIEQFKQMVDVFMEAGNTYFDTARVYHNGCSEGALRQALVERYPRDSFTIATKTLAWSYNTAEEAKANLETSLAELGVDYIDYYLLHNVGGKRTAKFDNFGMWEHVKQAKAEGKIRHIGLSIHDDAETLDAILADHPEVEFVQLQVNYLDWNDPVTQSKKLVDIAYKYELPFIVMEPARGGRLAVLPKRAQEVLDEAGYDEPAVNLANRFCYNIPGVLTVLSGMSTLEQVQENVVCYANNAPFSDEEKVLLDKVLAALKSVEQIPCTNCGYCVKDCPEGVKIPQTLGLLNLEAQVEDHEFVKELFSWQTAEGRPSLCIECGNCEDMCPQSINIIDQLQRAVDLYE